MNKCEELNATDSQSKIIVNYCLQEKYHTKYFCFPDDMIRQNIESHSKQEEWQYQVMEKGIHAACVGKSEATGLLKQKACVNIQWIGKDS